MRLAAADVLAGAKSRLLPAAIPFRYFAAAALFHVLFWAALALAAPDVPQYRGGPGAPLGALHLLTLGVFAMTAAGAAFQLLPVATQQPLRSLILARSVIWLLAPGVLLLAAGMAVAEMLLMAAGGTLAVLALLGWGVLVGDNLARTRGMATVIAHAWTALAALAGLLLLGVGLIADFRFGFLPDHGGAALAHLVLAAFGFMGMLAAGLSYVLVPMFALSPGPPLWQGRAGVAFGATGLVLAATGALLGQPVGLALGALCGLVAAGAQIGAMIHVMRSRMRKALGRSFILIRLSWGLLPASLLLGLGLSVGLAVPQAPALFGFLVLAWLLTFLTGILQRIVPFLASMHTGGRGGRPALVSELARDGLLRVHMWGHLAALTLVGAGILLDQGLIVRLGALAGLVGAVSFAWFVGEVVARVRPPPRPD